MVYKAGRFAFDDVTDRGARERAKHLELPPTKKACRDGTHVFSQYVGSPMIGGIEHIQARCPDCKQEFTFPAYAKDRE